MRNLRNSYRFYRKSYKSVKIDDYLNICDMFNKFLVDKVLEGEEVTLPSKFGTLCIMGREQRVRFSEDGEVIGLSPDWRRTKILWENNEEARKKRTIVYCTNEHTDNIRYKFLWSKKRVLIENKTLYSLRMTRTNKRVLHNKILEGKEYITR